MNESFINEFLEKQEFFLTDIWYTCSIENTVKVVDIRKFLNDYAEALKDLPNDE